MVESKWLSRFFLRPQGPESERSPQWPAVGFGPFNVVTKTDHHGAARDALATNAITNTAELTLKSQLRSLIEISVAMFSNGRVSSSGLKLGVKCS